MFRFMIGKKLVLNLCNSIMICLLQIPVFPMDLKGLINASISDECNVMLTTIPTSEKI